MDAHSEVHSGATARQAHMLEISLGGGGGFTVINCVTESEYIPTQGADLDSASKVLAPERDWPYYDKLHSSFEAPDSEISAQRLMIIANMT